MKRTVMFGMSPMVLIFMNALVNFLFGYELVLETQVVDHELRLEVTKSNEEELALEDVTLTVLFGDDVVYEGEYVSTLALPYQDDFSEREVDITTSYDKNIITFSKSELDLTSTPNRYEVNVQYKSKSTSESVETETMYEIADTKYFIDELEIGNEPIDLLTLPEVATLRMAHISGEGSISLSEIPVYNPTIFVTDENNTVKIHTNSEADRIYINQQPSSTFDKSQLGDTVAPNTPNVSYVTNDDNYEVVIKFLQTEDNATTHVLDVVVESDQYQKYQAVETSVTSGLKGYYYAVGGSAVSDVSEMTFTTDLAHMASLSKGAHVVSVVAQDVAGNLSEVSHTTISLVDLEKKALVAAVYPSGDSSIMTNKLMNVSSNLLNFLKNNGVVIKVASNLDQYLVGYASSYQSIKAVYVNSTNQMMFRQKSETDLSNILSAHFYHELGHAIDDNTGDPAMSSAFYDVYDSGKEVLFSGNGAMNVYFKTNVWEYFAECVNLYYTNRSALQKHDASYQFIVNHLNKYGL